MPSRFPTIKLPLLIAILTAMLAAGFDAPVHAAPPADRKPHTVLLHWAASPEASGYNVYRADKSGGPYKKLNRIPVPETQYTDTAVKAGKTYFYVVASIGSNNAEGEKSSEIRAAVPTP